MVEVTERGSDPTVGRAARFLRTPWVLRLASSCLGSVLAGIVVGGTGARLAMRVSAIAAGEDARGLVTDNGNVVGAITGEGTFTLLVFVGLAAGLVSGLFLAVLRTLLPARFLPLTASVVLLAVAGHIALDPANPDFTIVGHRVLNVAMFAALFPAFAVAAIWVAERFDRWLVRPPLVRVAPLTIAGAAVGGLVGLPGVLILAGGPGSIAAATMAVAVVSGIVAAVVSGPAEAVARAVGITAIAAGTFVGLLRLLDDVATILG